MTGISEWAKTGEWARVGGHTEILAAPVLQMGVLAAQTLLEDEEIAVLHGIDRRRRVLGNHFLHRGRANRHSRSVVAGKLLSVWGADCWGAAAAVS